MNFSIRIKRSAARELERVAKADRARIIEAIDRLAEHPLLGNALKGELSGVLRRLRVDDYRVVYEVQDEALIVLVIHVTHKGNDERDKRGVRNNGS